MANERPQAAARPTLPFTCRTELSAVSLVEFSSNYITSARSLLDGMFDGSTNDSLFGVYHVVCLAEATVEAAHQRLDQDGRGTDSAGLCPAELLHQLIELLEGDLAATATDAHIAVCREYLRQRGIQ